MGLPGRTELAIMSLLERILLSQTGLPGRTKLVLIDLQMDLRAFYSGLIRITEGITNKLIIR